MVIEQSKINLNSKIKNKHGWTTRDEIIFLNGLPVYVKDRRFQGFTEKPLLTFIDGYMNSLHLRKRGFESVDLGKIIAHIQLMRLKCIRGKL